MALSSKLMGCGLPAQVALNITGDVANGITAAGTTQATATELYSGLNRVSTVASLSGVKLYRATVPGDSQVVYNDGANSLLVYPATGDTIDGFAVNLPQSVPVGQMMLFQKFSATEWATGLFSSASSASFIDLNVTGNTTLGDASGDSITFNAGTWTLSNDITETRALGTAAAGTTAVKTEVVSFTGHSGGTSDIRGRVTKITSSGANNITQVEPLNIQTEIQSTGTTSFAFGAQAYVRAGLSGVGACPITTARVFDGHIANEGTGNITDADVFHVGDVDLQAGSGLIGTMRGVHIGDQGHATRITSGVAGVDVEDMTSGAPVTAAFRSRMNSGGAKWGLFMSGTANNGFAGPIYPPQDTKAIQTAAAIYAGTGAPNNANGSNGDFYFRGDGTAGGNTIIYHKEAGSWVAAVTT